MSQSRKPFHIGIDDKKQKGNGRKAKTNGRDGFRAEKIDREPAPQHAPSLKETQKPLGQFPVGRARVAPIDMPVDETVQRERRRPGPETGSQQKPPQRPSGKTTPRQNRPAENERNGEKRMLRLDKAAV